MSAFMILAGAALGIIGLMGVSVELFDGRIDCPTCNGTGWQIGDVFSGSCTQCKRRGYVHEHPWRIALYGFVSLVGTWLIVLAVAVG